MTLSLSEKCICGGRNPACSTCGGFGYMPAKEEKSNTPSKRGTCNRCNQYFRNLTKHMANGIHKKLKIVKELNEHKEKININKKFTKIDFS